MTLPDITTLSLDELRDLQAVAGQRMAALALSEVSVSEQLTADTAADLPKVRGAVDALAVLLADNATPGSIRAWRATVSGAELKSVADLLIAETKATRTIARQTLRLALAMSGELDSADVGTEDAVTV